MTKLEKQVYKKVAMDVGGQILHFLLGGSVLMYLWSQIAYHYNQPEFGFWFYVGFYWLVTMVNTSFKKS